ncbi:XRE family transcriptional regulator [Mesorhizobium sp. CAU 1741]|uniref:XRE family transcriptional regulator n=1 Tax=Mesorhizobium sp. CAU 1741 TaxID=3140366 RepID=UPI00325B496F
MSRRHRYEDTRLTRFLEKRILELRPQKSQADIAVEAGFVSTNMLTMIKTGAAKLPLDRVPGLAKALDCDARRLFQLALEQGGGDTVEVAVREIFGAVVTRNEVAWIDEIRAASDNSDPSLTLRGRAAIRGIFGK